MSAFAELLDDLIRLDAKAKAATDLAKPVRAKATQMVIERYQEEGTDRFRRDGAVVSLIRPSAYAEVTRPEALCEWLEANGMARLVVDTPVIVNSSHLAQAVKAVADAPPPSEDHLGNEVGGFTAADADDFARLLLECVDVRRQPVADWPDHLTWDVTPDGTMVTPDGEPIPGATWVQPEPRSIRIAPTKDAIAAAKAALGGA